MRKLLYFFLSFLVLWGLPFASAHTYHDAYYDTGSFYDDYFGDWYGVERNWGYDPFGDWYGVENMRGYNPFGYWYGVDNMSYTSEDFFGRWSGVRNIPPDYNPFGQWHGVRNLETNYDPFGTWTGVRNLDQNYSAPPQTHTTQNTNPFGQWSGVSTTSSNAGPGAGFFGNWSGVNNMTAFEQNPFGQWYGVGNLDNNNGAPFGNWSGSANIPRGSAITNNASNIDSTSQYYSGYDPYGYQVSEPYAETRGSPQTTTTMASRGDNYFVAPRTGVSGSAPFIFAGIITTLSLVAVKRKQLYRFVFA